MDAIEIIVLVLKARHPEVVEARIRLVLAESYAAAFRGELPFSEVVHRTSGRLVQHAG